MQILILRSFAGDPDGEYTLLAPPDMLNPEEAANLVIRRAAEMNPDITWNDVRKPLLDAGFAEPTKIHINPRPWDESRSQSRMTFRVVFPVTAQHEHAGKTLVATNTVPFEDGGIVLIDEHQQLLNAEDQLWHAKHRYVEQVPLGPVEVPDSQFSSPKELQRAIRLLQKSGFQVANKIHPANAA